MVGWFVGWLVPWAHSTTHSYIRANTREGRNVLLSWRCDQLGFCEYVCVSVRACVRACGSECACACVCVSSSATSTTGIIAVTDVSRPINCRKNWRHSQPSSLCPSLLLSLSRLQQTAALSCVKGEKSGTVEQFTQIVRIAHRHQVKLLFLWFWTLALFTCLALKLRTKDTGFKKKKKKNFFYFISFLSFHRSQDKTTFLGWFWCQTRHCHVQFPDVCLSKRLSRMRVKSWSPSKLPLTQHSVPRRIYSPKISAAVRSKPVVIVAAGTTAETTENFK